MIARLCILFGLCVGDITGEARVIDGDTIVIDKQHIRLQGVDAEELSEQGGHAARMVLSGIVSGRLVACRPDGTISYERIVARCYIDGIDIAIPLIAGGWALDCPRFSGGRYLPYELPGAREHLSQKRYCK